MSERPKISQEELDREYEWMDSRKKHSYNHRMINRKMRNRRIVRIAIIVFLVISVLATIFVLVFHRYYQNENVTKSGVYAISESIENEHITLSYDKEHKFEKLLGSGRTGSQSRGNSEVTSLLAKAATSSEYDTVFSAFVGLVNQEVKTERINDQSVGKEYGVQYFDEDDKSYIAFYDSYYVNRFYLMNDSEEEVSTKLTINFTKVEDFEIYNTARLILAINDGESIKYLAFAAKNPKYNEPEAMATREKDATTQAAGRDFLLDPNIEQYKDGVTAFAEYDQDKLKEGIKAAEDPKNTWYPLELIEVEEGIFAYTYEGIKVSANSSLEFTLLFMAVEESDYDFNADTMSRNEMGIYINFSE